MIRLTTLKGSTSPKFMHRSNPYSPYKERAMEKIDLKKTLREFYSTSSKEVVFVNVPPMNFLMVDGEGDPNVAPSYAEAIEALFTVSYTLKFAVKKGQATIDYAVMPLEGLWWADDMSAFSTGDKSQWKWTAMMMQPDFITEKMVEDALAVAGKKKTLLGLERIRLEVFGEGVCAQILHVGPYSEEGPTIEKLHSAIESRGKRRGKHHEIYLSDIRRADPAQWKTIVRQPME
jgi:hypothetical protein